jgi:tetratricopeptide (TPR) repeat protein
MDTGKAASAVILIVTILLGVPSVLPAASAGSATYQWTEQMRAARRLGQHKDFEGERRGYEEAAAMAPSEELKADSLFYAARTRQLLRMRWEAIATYNRIISECPSSGRVCGAYTALAGLYYAEVDLPEDAPEEQKKKAADEMSIATGIAYLELAVKAAPSDSSILLGTKLGLAYAYAEAERVDEGRAILLELNGEDIYFVKEPRYVGPFQEITLYDDMPRSSKIDGARCDAAAILTAARLAIVNWSVDTRKPAESMIRLQALIDKYPGGELAELAQKEIDRISKQMADEAKLTPPSLPAAVMEMDDTAETP